MGMPAARVTDMHTCPMSDGPKPHVGGPVMPPCAVTVLTGMLPQARVTDLAMCASAPDMIVKGSATVLVNGLMAARQFDQTAHGGLIVVGLPTVLIGDAGAGGGGGGGGGAGGGGYIAPAPMEKALGEVAGPAGNYKNLPKPADQAETLRQAAKDGTPFCERC